MTLILGRISQVRIELGADGLSTSSLLGFQPGRTTLQKLFRMESHPIAVAQVGANSIKRNGRDSSLSSVLGEAIRLIDVENSGIPVQHVASALADRMWSVCESGDFNLWVVGFEQPSCRARVFRVEIRKSNGAQGPSVTSASIKTITDGSGKRFVSSMDDDLYDTFRGALDLQEAANEFSFGGHWHSLLITPCCPPTWIHRPSKGTLGLHELIEPLSQSGVCLSAASPKEDIGLKMNHLKGMLSERAQTEQGKRPRTIPGFKEHWERGRTEMNPPDWQKVHQLVAIGDEANIADAGDVSDDDASLYSKHVCDLVTSLPPPL